MWILLSLWLSIPRYGLYSLCRKNVNSDLKNGMQQHGSVFRIPEEITSLDYFSLSSTDSFSNMEEEYMRKKNIIFTLCYHTLGNSSYLQSSVELEEKKKEQGEPYNIKKRVCRIHLLSCLKFLSLVYIFFPLPAMYRRISAKATTFRSQLWVLQLSSFSLLSMAG